MVKSGTLILIALAFSVAAFAPISAYALSKTNQGTNTSSSSQTTNKYYCGGGKQAVQVGINFGCQGKGNPIMDMLFAIIRLLSDGVGLVVIASLIVAGIQYTSSRGDPQLTAKAVHRLQSNVTALIIFFFAYAILNYLIPGQVL